MDERIALGWWRQSHRIATAFANHRKSTAFFHLKRNGRQRWFLLIGKRNIIDYLVCNNLPTLIYMINLGCIDVNPWNSTTASPDHPDYIVIDLDPTDKK